LSEASGDCGGDGFGFGLRLLARHPETGVAGAEQFAVAPAVALEGDRGGVEVAAVGLEDEAVAGPEEVDLDRAAVGEADRGVGSGPLGAGAEDERQDHRLQRALEALGVGNRGGVAPLGGQSSGRGRAGDRARRYSPHRDQVE